MNVEFLFSPAEKVKRSQNPAQTTLVKKDPSIKGLDLQLVEQALDEKVQQATLGGAYELLARIDVEPLTTPNGKLFYDFLKGFKELDGQEQCALHWADYGFPVLPVHSGHEEIFKTMSDEEWEHEIKSPVSKFAPHSFYSATLDANRIKMIWREYPFAGIGVPMGAKSGLLCIDCDVDVDKTTGEKILGYDRLVELLSALNSDIPTLEARTRKGGTHCFFKFVPQLPVKNWIKIVDSLIDIRTRGSYIVAPGSRIYKYDRSNDTIIEAGAYSWINNNLPKELSTAFATYACLKAKNSDKSSPITTVQVQANIGYEQPQPTPQLPATSVVNGADCTQNYFDLDSVGDGFEGTYYGLAALLSACEEVNTVPEGARNDTLSRETFSINALANNKVSIENASYAFGKIYEAARFRDNPLPESEIRVCMSAAIARSKNVVRQEEGLPGSEDEQSHQTPQGGAGTQSVTGNTPQGTVFDAPKPTGITVVSEETLPQDNAVNGTKPWPNHILHPGGLLEKIMNYEMASAYKPMRLYTLGSAIALLSVVVGQRVALKGVLPNLYVCILGDTCTGKNEPLQRTTSILIDAGLSECYGGSAIPSGSSIITAVEEHRRCIYTCDECSFLFSSVKKKDSYTSDLPGVLMDLFTRKRNFLKQYAKKDEKRVIPWFSLSFLGTSTPDSFWKSFTTEDCTNGLLGRFIFFEYRGPEPVPNRNQIFEDTPSDIVDGIRRLWSIETGEAMPQPGLKMKGAEEEDQADIEAEQPIDEEIPPTPNNIFWTDEAEELYWKTEDTLRKMRDTMNAAGKGIYGRCGEIIKKLALIKFVSDYAYEPNILQKWLTKNQLQWAIDLVLENKGRTMQSLDGHIVDSLFDELQKKVFDAIKRYTQKITLSNGAVFLGAKRTPISKALHLPPRDLDAALKHLVDAGQIEEVKAKNPRGRDSIFYKLGE